jgi:putative ABC transport system permease protein
MNVLLQDLRFALRTLRRDLGFTAAIILTLAIGVGVNTAVFGVLRSTLFEPLPYDKPERLVMVWTSITGQNVHESPSAQANIQDWKAQNRVFEDLATFDPISTTLTGGDWPEKTSAVKVSANLFSVLGVAPAIGRGFSAEEEHQQARVTVVSHSLWQRRFSGSPDAIGQLIEIAGTPFQVLGVMPDGFAFPGSDIELWLPQTVFDDWNAVVARRGTDAWRVLGRLRSGVSVEQARNEMNVIAGQLELAYPRQNAGLRINLVPLHDQVTGQSFRLVVWMLFGAVGLVLLIACSNVANLFLVRGMNRAQEFALRVALGATTPRLIRQAVTESVMLSVAAGIVGLLLAVAGLRLFVALAPGNIPRLDEIGVDSMVLTYGMTLAMAAGMISSIAPTLGYSRGAVYHILREARGSSERGAGHYARRLLIAGQFALAIILVFGANLLIRSLIEASRVDPGFRTESVLLTNLSVESESRRLTFYEQVVPNVAAIPGVRAVGIAEEMFISGAPNRAITIEGHANAEPSFAPLRVDAIAGDFFQVLEVPLRAGRHFSRSDGADAVPVAIVNETMARRFWPGEMPIGKRFRTGTRSDAQWIEIVGVVGDMRRQGLEEGPIPQVFRPYVQLPSRNMILVARTERPVRGIDAAIRRRIAELDATVALPGLTTLAQALDRYLLQRRFQTLLLGLFSAIALMLAAVGIYGLLQHSVAQRTREIGVRMAVGAASHRVIAMILRQGLIVVLPGLALGVIGAVWLSGAIAAMLFRVPASDVTNIAVTSGILLLTTLLASYLPARRAANVDPMVALRYQ